MIILRKFTLKDYEELVDMYYSFCIEIYSDRKIGYKYSFYKAVDSWIQKKNDIILAVDGDAIVGFSMCYVDNMDGLTEPVYNADMAYVKEEYRKSRAGYLLFKNGYDYANDIGLKLVSLGRVENGVDKMIEKHFDLKKKYIMFEGVSNG